MKEFCRYAVIDIETGDVLSVGYKYKDFSKMRPDGTFRTFPCFWIKRKEYIKLKIIKDRLCCVFYWTGERAKARNCTVLSAGKNLRLRGMFYSDEYSNFGTHLGLFGGSA